MKLQGIVIEKEDVAKIGNQFCNIPFFYKGSFRICNYNPNLLNRNFCNGYETSKRYFSSGAL